MKILYHHRIASKDGQYVHVEEIINALKLQGHEIILVAPKVAENSEFGSDGGFVDTLKSKLPQWLYELAEFTYAFYAFIKLSIAIIRYKPDAIYERYNLFLPAGIWAKNLFGLPFLLEVNAPIYEERKKYDGIALDGLAKWSQAYCWRHADKILPVTDVLADYARELDVPESQIVVIPNGINHERFSDSLSKPDNYDKDESIVIGFVGFVRAWHGLDRVLSLMKELEEVSCKLLIVGDGPEVEKLEAQAQTLGMQEKLYVSGIVERDEMFKWLNIIDIALQPDVTHYASPLKMLEYMATGKAIIAPDAPNIKELLTNNYNALLFNSDDSEALQLAIKSLCKDENLRNELGCNAALTIEQKSLTWQANASQIVSLFAECE
ncbi:glycosyltransferase family 4 protein [Glaciecola sp. KUL10]|uniref:glycosyltransferase family 4 protein n=1 Tax=Glaciecola sp. (strain KUL10) TaxID=2161813 RepID=UPI000D78BD20|nr:glycosyltransferase family 4 protein [Glaciecola sp. KUL10]GBL04248.1 group 1 glycosyl transferase [Glaciecola sp. KUL10]